MKSSHKSRRSLSCKSSFSIDLLLEEEGAILDNGQLVFEDAPILTQELAGEIYYGSQSCTLIKADFDKLVYGMTKGAKYMAHKIYFGHKPDLAKLSSDWAATKELRKWMMTHPDRSLLEKLELISEGENGALYYGTEQLLQAGVRFAGQAERFIRLYDQLRDPHRAWISSKQVNQMGVAILADHPYTRLPLWVKKILAESPAFLSSRRDRPGDIWRLKNCARAWKWEPSLPKNLAEKIGRLSPKMRLYAKLAWQQMPYCIIRSERDREFWLALRRISSQPILELAMQYKVRDYELDLLLDMPYGTSRAASGISGKLAVATVADVVATAGSPKDATKHLFGHNGKATVAAFVKSGANEIRWAAALRPEDPNLLQKILALPQSVTFTPEATDFIRALPPTAQLRLLSAVTYRYRGEDKPVESFLVRDTGYLWLKCNQEQQARLGRVRCWLSAHEDLARIYISGLPDGPLDVNPDFAHLDGLSSVDRRWRLVMPRRIHHIVLWGETLHHCVGGYGPAINSGRSIIVGLEVGGQMTYTIEYCPTGGQYSCRQFMGSYNSAAPRELEAEVLEEIRIALKGRRPAQSWADLDDHPF